MSELKKLTGDERVAMVMAYVQAGKRGCGLEEALACAADAVLACRAQPVEAQKLDASFEKSKQSLADLILCDPDGGSMVISSGLTVEHDGALRFELTNPSTGRRAGVYLGITELKPHPTINTTRQSKESADQSREAGE